MTIEQYKALKVLGDNLLYLNNVINALETSESKSRLSLYTTYYTKNSEGEYVPESKEYQFYDRELIDAFLKILKEKRDRLTKEFEEL